MENIKKVMSQAAYSTREQAAGGRQVRLAVENINKIASQVGLATREQAEGSRQIINAVERMNDMTQQVSHATASRRREVSSWSRRWRTSPRSPATTWRPSRRCRRRPRTSPQQAENLARLVSVFKVQ